MVVANARLATNEVWRDKTTEELLKRTEWHRIVFFDKLGEIANRYLKKGSKIYVEGRIQTKKWQGQDGENRYTTEIIVNEMQMLGSAKETQNILNNTSTISTTPQTSGYNKTTVGDANLFSDINNEIPF